MLYILTHSAVGIALIVVANLALVGITLWLWLEPHRTTTIRPPGRSK